MQRLNGKVALVTGAASGIGAGIARLFIEEGARVMLADINVGAGSALADQLGPDAAFVELDVGDPAAWERAMADLQARWGGLDILVQSAGISFPAHIEAAGLDAWEAHLWVHARGAFLGCQNAVASMKRSGGGSIVNISSVESIRPGPLFTCYGAAKAAQDAVTRTVALHCGEQGYNIRCNSVHPAATRTPNLQQYLDAASDPAALEAIYAGMQPLNRIAEVGEIAAAVLFLASDEASFVTGHQMYVDGGVLAKPYPAGEGA
ncbi:SDR family oxidoreductase [Pseudomonas jinjuensis]|uniref:3(Or 17)beta-hydroxysteroid dehydrogenase n=1 Tax=Pseudomonas jinjuensis TaxID=198616 RepID=A0A1H0EJY4_9PSED|nr:SDR family oxidoreductase [Pseudomonas jinjuensis]SDN82650.1 3(or 17)beta-hydroxysteroid dehydrogenase [Pseudomonas jinjuensis]